MISYIVNSNRCQSSNQSLVDNMVLDRTESYDASHQPCSVVKRVDILGAIAGDIIGSRYECFSTKRYDFCLFTSDMRFTDDTVMTMAINEWLEKDPSHDKDRLTGIMQDYGRAYPYCGYGGKFREWIWSADPQPYYSWGNGAAMRVSPVGFKFDSLEETLQVARLSAEVSHNHPEGIKGAQAVAAAIFLARHGESKESIKDYIQQTFGYDLNRTCEELRPDYRFEVSCQESVPQSILAFLDSKDYEDALRLSVSMGGDADTMGCITGGIAAAFYKNIPKNIYDFCMERLPECFRKQLI